MRKTTLLKTFLLLCALVVGSSSAWATATTYSFSNIPTKGWTTNGGSQTINDITWTYSGSTYISGGAAIQVGSAKNPQTTDWTIQTPISSFGTNKVITAVSITANTTAATATYDISVGGTSVKSGSLTTSSTIYSVSDLNVTNGNIVVTLTGSSTSKAMYLTNISVTYDDASSDPSSGVTFTDRTPSINYPAQKTYSQIPTTATGYNGTITYSMTTNTAGATIDESTGVVTVTGGGSVTVKAVAAAVSGSFASSEDSYTLTVNDSRGELGDNDLKWSAESADVTYGADNNIFPTLTNTHNVAVTYESTNTNAATIDANTGVITLKDVTLTTYIKAIFAGNDDYLPKTVGYTLNVSKAPFAIRDGIFDFVEAAKADPLVDYGSGVTLSNGTYVTEDKTWTAGNVTMVTSKVSGNGYRWWGNDGTLRFYNESKATFSVPTGYVITKIVTTGANFDSANPASLSSGTWTGASNEVTLSATNTHNIKTITVTYTTATQAITPAYAKITYVTPYKMDFTNVEGLKAYVATGADAEGVTMTEVTAAVPENTPLMLKGTAGTTYNVPVAASATAPATNKLRAGDGTTVFDGSTYDYLLYSDGKFYQIGSGTIATNKAYLHLESDPAGARALDIIFDGAEASSISDAVKSVEKNEGYFDLQGRRVAQPTKGLYIVNGKKVIVK